MQPQVRGSVAERLNGPIVWSEAERPSGAGGGGRTFHNFCSIVKGLPASFRKLGNHSRSPAGKQRHGGGVLSLGCAVSPPRAHGRQPSGISFRALSPHVCVSVRAYKHVCVYVCAHIARVTSYVL